MKALFYLLPILAGVAMSIQSGINSQLRIAINHPLMAALISFLGGTFLLMVLLLFAKQPTPSIDSLTSVSWYKFTGGLLGAFVVTVVLLSVKEVGASNMFVLIVAGQLFTALLMDHFGVLGMRMNPVSFQKIAGITLVVAGAYLVNRK